MKKNILKFWFIIAVVCFFLLGSSGCSIFMAEKKPLTEPEACKTLKELIADHPNKFEHFKKGQGLTSIIVSMRTWNAKRVFPLAKNCQIWEWSSGLTSYVCSWNEKDKQKAKESHDKGADIVRQCLDKSWHMKSDQTTTGGERTLFYQDEGKTVVSVRYFKEQRSILENWKATLYVGDESNLNGEIQ